MQRYNPFRPGSIVHTGMFAGRTEEIRTIRRALFQTANGNATHFLIHGERGIGKTSLLSAARGLAKGYAEIDDTLYSYLTVTVELEPSDTYTDLIRKIAREFYRELDSSNQIKSVAADIWTFVTNWEVMGVKYNRDTTPPEAMLEELADKFGAVARKLNAGTQGIYLLIDEADKPAASAGLGGFLKVFTERLSRNGVNNVAVGISGVSTVINKMKQSHESAIRIPVPLLLAPLLPDERKEVVRLGLAEANKKNAQPTIITDEALDLISRFSEGYPHFIQQYAYSAFDEDNDFVIDAQDVRRALTKEGGALQLLGERFFESMYTDEIRSDAYRKVLQVVARHFPDYVTRKEIVSESKLKEHTVNNALTTLVKRGSINAKKGARGLFRTPSQSFAAWILAFKIAK